MSKIRGYTLPAFNESNELKTGFGKAGVAFCKAS
jgi:hypothetical protein